MKITLSYSEMTTAIHACVSTGIVPYIVSPPALGKSALVAQFAKQNKLKLIDLRLSSLEPVDLNGAVRVSGNLAQYVPFDVFPIEGTKLEDGYEGVLLFLDELPSAHRQVISAAYKLILDRAVGQFKLADNCFIVCAGNSISDNAIVNEIGTAMQSRMIQYNLKVTAEDWLNTVAIPQHYDPRIIAFITANPDKISTFNPKLIEESFGSPRTYDFVNRILSLTNPQEPVSKVLHATITGALGSEAGTAFMSFLKVYAELPTVESALNSPLTAKLPQKNEAQWAILCSLMAVENPEDLRKAITYVDRFPQHMQRFFYSSAIKRKDVENTVLAYDLDRHSCINLGRELLAD